MFNTPLFCVYFFGNLMNAASRLMLSRIINVNSFPTHIPSPFHLPLRWKQLPHQNKWAVPRSLTTVWVATAPVLAHFLHWITSWRHINSLLIPRPHLSKSAAGELDANGRLSGATETVCPLERRMRSVWDTQPCTVDYDGFAWQGQCAY